MRPSPKVGKNSVENSLWYGRLGSVRSGSEGFGASRGGKAGKVRLGLVRSVEVRCGKA